MVVVGGSPHHLRPLSVPESFNVCLTLSALCSASSGSSVEHRGGSFLLRSGAGNCQLGGSKVRRFEPPPPRYVLSNASVFSNACSSIARVGGGKAQHGGLSATLRSPGHQVDL